ncbi:MAG: hypothetical protein H6737_04620 [Alphaproteobacteria bacterium]|nr:hypothetical protein [Alphaproteobacteria bacterium]
MSRWIEPVVAGLLALFACEGALRCAGLGPWRPFESFANVPTLSASDPALGWVNAPGTFVLNGTPVTIAADGTRGPTAEEGRSVGLFGGSYAFGYGLGDADVLTAVLQALRPDLSVRNHAVPGYGTLQSVLLYESLADPPHDVIYGLVELHDGRNAAAWSWLHALERASRGQAWVAVPGAWWDGESLVYAAPIAYHHWAASERSALIDRLEHARNAVHDRFLRTKAETTVRLVLRFRDAVQADGGRFRVALLDAPTRHPHYLARFAEEGVDVLDLRHPQLPAWSIPGDGHPDARVHRDWGTALAEAL